MSHNKKSCLPIEFLFVTILAAFLLIGCQRPTGDKKSVVHGRIQLEGQTTHEGVTVLLYVAGVVQDQLLSYNQNHPGLGFAISDQHLFDHREHLPISVTTTVIDGGFKLPDIAYDKYILVALKSDFAPVYIYDVIVNEPDYHLDNSSQLTMNPLEVVPETVAGHFIFEHGKSYQTVGNVTFLPGSKAEFRAGTQLFVAPGTGLSFHGEVTVDGIIDLPVMITSGSGIDNYTHLPLPFNKLEIKADASVDEIDWLIFKFSTEGLVLEASDIHIRNSVFLRNNIACQVLAGVSLAFLNSYFIYSDGASGTGLMLSNATDVEVKNCVFKDLQGVSLITQLTRDVIVDNCMFQSGNEHINNSFNSRMIINHSTLIGARYALTNIAKSNLEISFSEIDALICVYSRHLGNQINTPSNGWIKANNNNFKWVSRAVFLGGYYFSTDEYVILDFTQNYWDTTEISIIEDAIIDYYDQEPLASPNTAWPLVQFIPIKTVSVPNAGVR